MKLYDFTNANNFIRNPQRLAVCVMPVPNTNKFNAITLEWFMKTSIKPPMFAISVGHRRFSYKCLLEADAFNLVIPSEEQIESVKFFGSKSGHHEDKHQNSGLKWFNGRFAKIPVFSYSAACFECKMVTQVKSGDHTIFVGEVKYSWVDENQTVLTLETFTHS